MVKPPRISGRKCGKVLESVGFVFVRHTKGSHMIYRRDDPYAQVTIPDTKK
jgi:predicted RNA binding protein YcfA (HicA-like mRNA interferase family)